MSSGRNERRAGATALATATSLALLLLVAGSVQAAFPGRNGDTYFQTETGSGTVIARVGPNGKKFRRLTPARIDAESVSVSPDGKRLAFECEPTPGPSDVCLANRNGKRLRTIARHPAADDGDPAWSPNGKWIVFESNRDGDNEIFKVRANGRACGS